MVAERVIPNVSASWNASLPISLLDTCPVERHDRNRVHHGVHQPRNQVGRARPGSRAAHANLSRRARISLRRKRRILLVPHQDVPDRVIVQGVIKRQRYAARISENELDILARQTFRRILAPERSVDILFWLYLPG